MKNSLLFGIGALLFVSGSAQAVQKEIFGIMRDGTGQFNIMRYDVITDTFQNCGVASSGFTTNLAMDANRRLYFMNPFEGGHVIWQGDLDGSNNLINQQVVDTLNPGLDIIDGFTIGPDQDLYMTGYGHSEIYRYDIGSASGTVTTEVTLASPGSSGNGPEYRSDLAFDPLTGNLVGIGIVPGSTRRSLFQIPASLATNGVNDVHAWEFFGGNASLWASSSLDLRSYLGENPDGVAFDPTTSEMYLSGDGEKFSLWDRVNAVPLNYLPIGGADTGMGFDLAFQTGAGAPQEPVPTVSGWGLAIMMLSLLVGWKIKFGRVPARPTV